MHWPDRLRSTLLSLLVAYSVTSCIPRPAWVKQTIDKPTCLAPCWRNITPGMTTREELLQILEQNSDVHDISSSVGYPWGPVISWCEGKTPCDIEGDISVFSPFDSNEIVQEIYIYPGFYLYLKDFIKLYGNPELVAFVDPISAPGYVEVDMLYPNIGLVIGFFTENIGSYENPSVDFHEDLDVRRIFYTIPGLTYYYSHNLTIKSFDQFQEFKWKGYTMYPQ